MTRWIIGIDGIDGSGKSVFGRSLADAGTARGLGSVVLAVDDFRRPVNWRDGDRSEADIYYEDYYDLDALDACLVGFASGAARLSVPVYDPAGEAVTGVRPIPLGGCALAVVEGVFARRMPSMAGATVLYLRTSFEEARRRILARDVGRGRSVEEVTRRIDARYFPSQLRYMRDHDPEDSAEVVVDNDDYGCPRVVRADLSATPGPVREVLEAVLGQSAQGLR